MSNEVSDVPVVVANNNGTAAAALSEQFSRPPAATAGQDSSGTNTPSTSTQESGESTVVESVRSVGRAAAMAALETAGSDLVRGAGRAVAEGAAIGEIRNAERYGKIASFNDKVTDKDRAEAKEELAKGLSDLIPEADRALLKQMQGAIIDGNVDQLKEALGKLANDPEKLGKFLKALNEQFKSKSIFGNIELSRDGAGNVLLYERNGSTAVSINPSTGETTLRAVERQPDGSMLLKPGEIIGKTVGDIMRSVGDTATRGVVGPHYHWKELTPLQRMGQGTLHDAMPNGNRIKETIQDILK